MDKFKLVSDYKLSGDQPEAVARLAHGVDLGLREQVLLGVTGSGKTFTMASVIEKVNKPTLVLAHNKTLAAQLCSEFREFFPDSAVEYFVSYYDYYQPEAYVPRTDTFIDKEASINEEIDIMRHSATQSLLSRDDVIVVSSVSCIYGIGSPEDYGEFAFAINVGDNYDRNEILRRLIFMQYERNDVAFERNKFRVRGDTVEIFPVYSKDTAIRVEFFGDEIDRYTMDQAVADGLTVSIKYHPRIAKVLLDKEKAEQIENYYKKCADDGATKEDVEASKKAMSSMEVILGEPSRLERLAEDIHNHYISSCEKDPNRVQKAMVVCASRAIAFDLLCKFKEKYPEWFVEKKVPDGIKVSEEKLRKLKPMPFMAMIASVGKDDKEEMYNYLGGVKNDKRTDDLDAAFKEDLSNFHIAIVVDMWITGFDVPSLTYLYNDKPLQKHLLIQTISRVNRKYSGKDYGFIIDYIGIRDNMREALKVYGGDNSVAPTTDDVEQATSVFREYLEVLKSLFNGYDLTPFLNPNSEPTERYRLLAKAAEYVFVSTQILNTDSSGGKSIQKVSFKTYFLKSVKRMRSAYDICQPSGELSEEESALAQCFMAIAGFVRKMSGTSDVDADVMNHYVSKMVEEALKYSEVESILEEGEEEDLFSPEFFEKLSDVKMPATKLELLIKMLRKQITDYSKTNQVAAKKFQEMLEKTIEEYHSRRKHLSAEEAGETQETTSEEIIKNATEQALKILKEMQIDKDSFRKVGLTFEEKAFYDILMTLRDEYNFEYGEDKVVDGVSVNDKCKSLAKKIKEIIDTKSSFADWLNNQIVRDQLKFDIKVCLIKNGYPPQYSPEVFRKVMEQVENFEENS